MGAAVMTADTLLTRVEGVRSIGPGRWVAKCPAHEDRSPSLSVRELEDGTVLIKCFAGCAATDVVAAAGLEFRDLFPERSTEHRLRPVRAALDARDALACLAVEGRIVAIAASDLAEGRSVTPQDADRIALAAGRIGRAWEACRGYR